MKREIEVKEFDMSRYEEVYALWKKVFPVNTDSSYDRDKVEFFLRRNSGTSLVAELDGVIIGALLAGHDGRRGYIHHLGVLEEYRGLGIGKRLIEETEQVLRKQGIEKVHLFVFQDNEPAKAFYRRIGFTERQDIGIFSHNIP